MRISIAKLRTGSGKGHSSYSRNASISWRLLVVSIGLALLLGQGGPAITRAGGTTVINLSDSGAGSLRQAIADASAGDTITFAVTGTITLTSGELVVAKDLTLSGPGAANLSISGNTNIPLSSRVINNSARLTIAMLTIRNGDAGVGSGGGILNTGTGVLTVTNSVITGNSAQKGGGVFNSPGGQLRVINSTFSANSSRPFDAGLDASGAGIYSAGPQGLANIINSTFSFNSVHDHGSGLYNSATATVVNSTFTLGQANTAAVYNETNGSLQLNNVTITLNGGKKQATGLLSNGGSVGVANSIIAGNITSGNNSMPDCGGTIASGGHNLIGNATDCNLSTGAGDLLGNDHVPILANLGPLQDHGGPTSTHALLAGSPAINAGSRAPPGSGGSACEASDQRGVIRSAPCDIGAYEQGSLPIENPLPTITGLLPATVPTNSADFTLIIQGTSFMASSTVYVGGAQRSATWLSPQRLSVTVLAADTAGVPGPLSVTVVNATPGGGISNMAPLLVYEPGSLKTVALPVIAR